MSNRRVVLELYKKLLKVSKDVFTEDARALTEANLRIQLEFKKNKKILDEKEIQEKLKVSHIREEERMS